MRTLGKFSALLVLFSLCFQSLGFAAGNSDEILTSYGKGWSEIIEGVPVYHLEGNEREMGRQYGYMAGGSMKASIDGIFDIARKQQKFLKYVPRFVFVGFRRFVGMLFWFTFPKNIKDHMKGIIEGAKKRPSKVRLNKFDLAFVNSIVEFAGILNQLFDKDSKLTANDVLSTLQMPQMSTNCDTMAVWGSRTVGGKTFQSRNADVETGQGLENYPAVLILKKDGKLPVALTTFAGMVGGMGAINSKGVAMGQVWGFSADIKIDTPWALRIRDIFMDAHSAKAAVEMYAKKPTASYGTNFVFADAGFAENGGNIPGYAIEVSAKNFASFESNDPKELELKFNGESVGLPLSEAVLRGDLTLDPKLRSRQSASNGPHGDPREWQAYQIRYKGLYDRILAYEAQGIKISDVEAKAISTETASRDGNLMNVVYGNTDREIWVAYSKIQPDGSVKQAYENPFIHIPFWKYLGNDQAQ